MALKIYKAALAGVTPDKIKEIKESSAEPFLRLAVTLPVLRSKASKKIKEAIDQLGYGAKVDASMPLVIVSPTDPGAVTVYPNLRASWTAEQISDYILGVLKDEHTKARFETPERALKLALKKEHTTLAKVIADHTNLKAIRYRDDQIRDKADHIAALFGKMEFKECKTPEDCYHAFKTKNGSCMAVGSEYYGDWTSKTWVEIADETGVFPSAWYLYQPYSKLCYLEVGGIPRARFMLFRTDLTKDEWPFWGDCKYVNASFHAIVKTEMETVQGKVAICSTPTVAPFRVPALFHPSLKGGVTVPHCPLPFCDAHHLDFSVWYDEEAKEFYFESYHTRAGGLIIEDCYDHKGFLSGNKVPRVDIEDVPKEESKAETLAVVKEVKPQPKKIPIIGGAATLTQVKEVKANPARATEGTVVAAKAGEDYSSYITIIG